MLIPLLLTLLLALTTKRGGIFFLLRFIGFNSGSHRSGGFGDGGASR